MIGRGLSIPGTGSGVVVGAAVVVPGAVSVGTGPLMVVAVVSGIRVLAVVGVIAVVCVGVAALMMA